MIADAAVILSGVIAGPLLANESRMYARFEISVEPRKVPSNVASDILVYQILFMSVSQKSIIG